MAMRSVLPGRPKGHLFPFEDMLVELLLQPLISKVDAQLFKAVLLEAFKAVDVQDANGVLTLLALTCQRKPSLSIGILLSRRLRGDIES